MATRDAPPALPGTEAELRALTGWEAAKELQRFKRKLPAALYRQLILDRAITGILERARRMVRHTARPTRAVGAVWPSPGEFDVERTVDEWRSAELHVTRVEPREVDVVAVLDMSLSMTGEKIALIALATAILRMKLEHVAVIAFDTHAHRLVRAGENVTLRELVRRVLEVPAQGYTNIEEGLTVAARELALCRRRERVGILFTDGCANVGGDPVPIAGRFPRLHVVHLGHHNPQGARTCQAMAAAGRGRVLRALTYQDLPDVVRSAVQQLFRT